MEIFITLTKYNTHQQRKEDTNCSWWLLSHLYWCLLYIPAIEQVRQNVFLRWVRAQGRRPDTPGDSKNASIPVGILPKKGASGVRQLT